MSGNNGKNQLVRVLTDDHSHTDVEENHTLGKNTKDEASADQECPSDGGHPDSKLATGHGGNGCYRTGEERRHTTIISSLLFTDLWNWRSGPNKAE